MVWLSYVLGTRFGRADVLSRGTRCDTCMQLGMRWETYVFGTRFGKAETHVLVWFGTRCDTCMQLGTWFGKAETQG